MERNAFEFRFSSINDRIRMMWFTVSQVFETKYLYFTKNFRWWKKGEKEEEERRYTRGFSGRLANKEGTVGRLFVETGQLAEQLRSTFTGRRQNSGNGCRFLAKVASSISSSSPPPPLFIFLPGSCSSYIRVYEREVVERETIERKDFPFLAYLPTYGSIRVCRCRCALRLKIFKGTPVFERKQPPGIRIAIISNKRLQIFYSSWVESLCEEGNWRAITNERINETLIA